jgi:hypothetical protein
MSSVLLARQVKNELLAKYTNEPWFAGIGTVREDGIGFVVKVTVRPGVPRPADTPPKEVNGVVVQVLEAAG